MPSTITAATASAISEPLPVKMRSFFGLSGMPWTVQDEDLPRRKLAPRLCDGVSDYREVRYRRYGCGSQRPADCGQWLVGLRPQGLHWTFPTRKGDRLHRKLGRAPDSDHRKDKVGGTPGGSRDFLFGLLHELSIEPSSSSRQRNVFLLVNADESPFRHRIEHSAKPAFFELLKIGIPVMNGA